MSTLRRTDSEEFWKKYPKTLNVRRTWFLSELTTFTLLLSYDKLSLLIYNRRFDCNAPSVFLRATAIWTKWFVNVMYFIRNWMYLKLNNRALPDSRFNRKNISYGNLTTDCIRSVEHVLKCKHAYIYFSKTTIKTLKVMLYTNSHILNKSINILWRPSVHDDIV